MKSGERIVFRKILSAQFLRVLAVLVAACGFAHSGAALAQASVEKKDLTDSATKNQNLTDAQGKKIQVVDFEDATIEGKAKAPEGFVLQSRTGSNFRNIIELRRDFRNRIQTSAPTVRSVSPASP